MLEICQNNAPEWILMYSMLQMTRRSATIIVICICSHHHCDDYWIIHYYFLYNLFQNTIKKRDSYEQLSHVNSEML